MTNRVVFRFLVVMLMVLPQIGHAACAWVLWKKHAAPLVDIAWSIMGCLRRATNVRRHWQMNSSADSALTKKATS